MPMDPAIEWIWTTVVDKIWINFTWKTMYGVEHSAMLSIQRIWLTRETNTIFCCCRISRIHRWCRCNRRHMVAMMLVSSPADPGHIYSVVFMNKIIYRMLWAMQRALEKVYRLVNKTKQWRCYFFRQFARIVTLNTSMRDRQTHGQTHNNIRMERASEMKGEWGQKPINVQSAAHFTTSFQST